MIYVKRAKTQHNNVQTGRLMNRIVDLSPPLLNLVRLIHDVTFDDVFLPNPLGGCLSRQCNDWEELSPREWAV